MEPTPATGQHPRRRPGRALLIAAGLAAFAVAPFALSRWWPRTPPAPAAGGNGDPRLTFPTPYLNVRPDVQYVGDAACAGCHHKKICDDYHRHPMGRSMAVVPAPGSEPEHAVPASFKAQGFEYHVEHRGGRTIHRETYRDAGGRVVTEREAEVRYVIGSGARGFSYLLDDGGFLFQSPISWYGGKKIWDLSPGYHNRNKHFDRAVLARCLYCHAGEADHVPGTLNHYREPPFRALAVGCERCHGPGELHVRRHRGREAWEGDRDYTIVNPRDLEPALRESVCQQCHLQGQGRVARRGRGTFDYRPGLPLHLFWSVFIRAPGAGRDNKAVGQVEQMHSSRCYRDTSGAGKLGCISCHDPHRKPDAAGRDAYYRGRCLKCHEKKGCKFPEEDRRAAGDSCVACHMPRQGATDVVHVAVTDHRILRRPNPAASADKPPPLSPDDLRFVHFHRDPAAPDDPEVARDLGVMLTEMADQAPGEPFKLHLTRSALPLLADAVRRAPDDVTAWEARGHALRWQHNPAEALRAFEAALGRAPEREVSLAGAGAAAQDLGKWDDSRQYWERAVAVSPRRWHYHYHLAQVLQELHDLPGALAECERALRLDPTQLDVRMIQVAYLLDSGRKDQARAAFDDLLALKPPREAELRRWFAQYVGGPGPGKE